MIWIFNYFSLSYIYPLMDPENPQYCVHSKRGVRGVGKGRNQTPEKRVRGRKRRRKREKKRKRIRKRSKKWREMARKEKKRYGRVKEGGRKKGREGEDGI